MTHRRLIPLAAIAALTLVLAACEITVTGPTPTFPPSLSGTVEAEVFVPTVGVGPELQLSASLSAQQVRYYRVNVPTARDLLYAEVDGNDLRVTLYTGSGNVLAVSESSRYFGASATALAVASSEVGTSSLSTTFFCLGPCAAIEPTSSSYVIGVRNLTNSPRTFDLYAYTMTATDESEPNDTVGAATGFGITDDPTGAIESLGDEDWYVYTGASSETLRFAVFNLDLDLVLEFPNDEPVTIVEGTIDGTTTTIGTGDVFRVYSRAGLAGPSTESRYQITLE